ncbi:MAG: hypothetical protein RL362_383 [Bacteroidota bacterium]
MNALLATLSFKCPSCREASLYENPKLYTFHRLSVNKKNCSHCGVDLQPEPGFYFGAAYVSWALTVATWVSVLVALKCFNAWGWMEFGFLTHPGTFLMSGIGTSLVLFPYMFRLSRSIWAHMFIPFNGDK